MLDAEALFQEMDQRNQGWVSHGTFKRWVHQNCHFTLSDNDMLVLQPLLDDARDGQITKDEFVTCFAAPAEPEELDHEAAEREHNKAMEEQKAQDAKKKEEEAKKAKQAEQAKKAEPAKPAEQAKPTAPATTDAKKPSGK